ncbi:Cytochrome c oxidase subunit 6b-1 [Heracleum sosnowskyi]|uniref:Cytochrome c oxidase subunit 6b-1 n=1 Tax=Heracleum sosnowskyi TaxID=360622 RepID=A0AAD8N260_9APIA|nr:Cytochrome c oxidase subunit 6b-1 [Heracleum sosnowskyi]
MGDIEKTPTLSEQYHLEKEENLNAAPKPEEEVVVDCATEAVKEVVAAKVEDSSATPESSQSADDASGVSSETPEAASGESSETPEAASGESSETADPASGESSETPVAASDVSSVTPDAPSGESSEAGESITVATEGSSESTENDNVSDPEAEETPGIKLETAPADFRFPTTNQSRHCFTRYVEYHRCVAAKGEDAPECDKFAKYYRSLCPGEWVDRWNEQRENGTFPGPL